jgi:hypothetical protein
MTLTARHLPREYDAYVRYPQGDQSSLEHEFLWIKQRVQDRPTFVLSHRVRCLQGGMAFVAERQFYVGQSYNALQILVAFVPAGDRTIVAYLNRTSTDQVAGFMKGTRHTMGRQIMEKEIRKEFEACLARLSPGAAPR